MNLFDKFKSVLVKCVVIFFIGLFVRVFIREFSTVNLIDDCFNLISLMYFGFMSFVSVLIRDSLFKIGDLKEFVKSLFGVFNVVFNRIELIVVREVGCSVYEKDEFVQNWVLSEGKKEMKVDVKGLGLNGVGEDCYGRKYPEKSQYIIDHIKSNKNINSASWWSVVRSDIRESSAFTSLDSVKGKKIDSVIMDSGESNNIEDCKGDHSVNEFNKLCEDIENMLKDD